ncbi:glycoside hydrolase family 6 protein [Cellulomonas sp. PS-H5]|uniref:glycoside hydrolase family 6 protein n=1 Tax=Cellulomonas sp. PS-H5 TaxID=2820400 RepID=UPI001C4EBE82|nr:glycoside hydrolase family 6 protein [Cellulomonas sp. PS-H5]MBW0254853.1 glycoside hydrolase family 6 protein [Cellulomonas sp. PS-H5]
MPRAARPHPSRPTVAWSRLLVAAVRAAAAALLVVVVLAPSPATASAPTPAGDRLTGGQAITAGASRTAAGSAHVLAVGADGDVTVRLGSGPVLWHTGTTGNPGARLVQQPSGALEVRSASGTLLWTTGADSPGARSIIKPDGVLYTVDTAGRLVWKSTTDGPALRTTPADRVPSGGLLLAGESIATGDVRLAMGADGDLVLTHGGVVVWRTGTTARGASARVTPAGDLQVVSPTGVELWSAGASAPGARLVVKDHARIYLISTAGASVWSTAAPTGERVPAVVTLPLPAALPVVSRPGSGSGGGASTDAGAGERVYRTVLSAAPPYADPASDVARAAATARTEGRTADAALLDKAASGGAARWLGPADGTTAVRAYAAAATAAGRTPVFVTYAIPDRDCGSYSAGGFATAAEYRAWVDAVAAGLRGSRPVVVVEPDALLHLERCGDRDQRLALLRASVEAYRAAGAEVYLDAASSNSFGWSAEQLRDMALRLRAAGVDRAAGFSVNVSNFQRSEHEVAYGTYLSALLGGKAFVVDTSRNGAGPLAGPDGTVWCNPEGRALGAAPGATGSGGPHVADLWIKTVGRSDGTCHGGPVAGTYWEDYTLGLASRAAW